MSLLMDKKSIVDIFNDMSFEEVTAESLMNSDESHLNSADSNSVAFDYFLEEAYVAQKEWEILPSFEKAAVLNKMSSALPKTSHFGADYFTFYSDLLLERNDQYRACGIVLLVLANKSPFFVFCSVVSAALAAGNAVIVCTSDEKLRNLESSFSEAGLPNGVCSFASADFKTDKVIPHQISHVVVFDILSKVQEHLKKNESGFSFLCPNNTAALLLESCDLIAAIEKILSHTWGSNSDKMLGVSTIIVQESIYEKFVNHLKFQLSNFNYDKNNWVLKDAFKGKHGQILRKFSENETVWSPTIILQYEDQDWEPDVGCIKVKICRTAKEGVALLNNAHHFLGMSVWTEISSLALEVASMLTRKCIWINSHGVISPGVPFTPSGSCGNLICGGISGITQFMLDCHDANIADNNLQYVDLKNFPDALPPLEPKEVSFMSSSGSKACKLWWLKSRKFHLRKIADFFKKEKIYFADLHVTISNCIDSKISDINLSENSLPRNLLTIQRKCPIGVIVLFLYSCITVHYCTIISLITSALVFGNAIIIVLEDDVPESLIVIIQIFRRFLPKDLVQVTRSKNDILYFVSDANVQSIWMYDESVKCSNLYQSIKTRLASMPNMHCWIAPTKIQTSTVLSQMCTQNKIIWLPKVDQFP